MMSIESNIYEVLHIMRDLLLAGSHRHNSSPWLLFMVISCTLRSSFLFLQGNEYIHVLEGVTHNKRMCLYIIGKYENFEHRCTHIGVDKCVFHLAEDNTMASIHTFYVALFAPWKSSHKSRVTLALIPAKLPCFFRIIQYNADTHNARTLTPANGLKHSVRETCLSCKIEKVKNPFLYYKVHKSILKIL